MRRATKDRERRAEDRERVAASPRQQTRLRKTHAPNRGHEDIEYQRTRLDDVGTVPKQSHHRDIAGAPRLADGCIKRGDDGEDGRKNGLFEWDVHTSP